jgi:hypothetical protein
MAALRVSVGQSCRVGVTAGVLGVGLPRGVLFRACRRGFYSASYATSTPLFVAISNTSAGRFANSPTVTTPAN